MDKFEVEFAHSLGALQRIHISHDGAGFGSAWFVEKIVIEDELTGKQYTFQLQRWLDKSKGSAECDIFADEYNNAVSNVIPPKAKVSPENVMPPSINSSTESLKSKSDHPKQHSDDKLDGRQLKSPLGSTKGSTSNVRKQGSTSSLRKLGSSSSINKQGSSANLSGLKSTDSAQGSTSDLAKSSTNKNSGKRDSVTSIDKHKHNDSDRNVDRTNTPSRVEDDESLQASNPDLRAKITDDEDN